MRESLSRTFRDGVGIDAIRLRVLRKRWQPFEQHIGRCIRPAFGSGSCRAHAYWMSARRNSTLTACSM
jgi:hypothetical protein